MSEELHRLTLLFALLRRQADEFADRHNARLPSRECPKCLSPGHVPGLRCPECGYRHPQPWAIVRDTEWGYEVVPLTKRRRVIARFEAS